MKYVIFKFGPMFHPALFPDHVSHDSVMMQGCEADSAGFFHLGKKGVEVSSSRSESLDLGPKIKRDENLIIASLANMGMYAFMNFES